MTKTKTVSIPIAGDGADVPGQNGKLMVKTSPTKGTHLSAGIPLTLNSYVYYVENLNSGPLVSCELPFVPGNGQRGGNFTKCSNTTITLSSQSEVAGLSLNASGNTLYLMVYNRPSQNNPESVAIWSCAILPTGKVMGDCIQSNTYSVSSQPNSFLSVKRFNNKNYFYMAGKIPNDGLKCTLSGGSSTSNSTLSCNDSVFKIGTTPQFKTSMIVFNGAGTYAYLVQGKSIKFDPGSIAYVGKHRLVRLFCVF